MDKIKFPKFREFILSITGGAILFGLVGSIASLLSIFIVNWEISLNIRWFIFVCLLFIYILLGHILYCEKLKDTLSDRIKTFYTPILFHEKLGSLIIPKNDMLSIHVRVSIFYIENNFEIPFGEGYVSNIQDKVIQIKVTNTLDVALAQKLQQNNADFLRRIRIKNCINYEI